MPIPAPAGSDPAAPFDNRLLAVLPAASVETLRPHLSHVALAAGEVLYGPGMRLTHVYFPTTAVVSVLTLLGRDAATRDGAPSDPLDEYAGGVAVEVGTVGREGIVGLDVFLSGDRPGTSTAVATADVVHDAPGVRAVAQVPGTAWCIPADVFATLAAPDSAFHRLLLRYTQAYLGQVAQTAACNAAHRLVARCARWLLITHDRTATDWIPLTHAFLSAMLGVRETGVASALAALETRGLIVATDAGVEIVDRAGLEGTTCACYEAVRAEYARLLDPAEGTPS